MAVPVKIEVPEGMYENIKKLVERKLFRNVADFFYVAGHIHLSRFYEVGVDSDA